VSNLGPDSASDILLTNQYSEAVVLQDIVPTNLMSAITNDALLLSLGSLNSGAVTTVALTVQPTIAGPLGILASVGASTADPNTTNNTVTTDLFVTNYLSGKLLTSLIDTNQHFNPQNGLMEQTIQLTNADSSSMASARLVVTGLPGNGLFNAAGTNNGNPFVVYAATLNTNQSVNLRLQFFVPTGLPFSITPSNQFLAYQMPLPVDQTPPPDLGTQVNITRQLQLTNPVSFGDRLIEFQSITNQAYIVVYSDDEAFTNARVAPPATAAPGDRMQWIDYGPPTTILHPTNVIGSNTIPRFYRVYLNP
jgi:hypothetical protein